MTDAVAVIGWAWRTPLGADVPAVMDALWAGRRAVAPLSDEVGPHTYPCKLCARIDAQPARSPHQRFVRRAGLWGLEAAHEAARAASLASLIAEGARVGVFVGYGGLRAHWSEMMPALADQTPDQTDLWRRGLRHLHPFWMLRYLSNNAHALFAADVGATADGATFGGGVSGAGAIAAAARALRLDAIDAAVVFAYDSLIHPDVLLDLTARGRATTAPDAAQWAAPYSAAADGGVPGEAAAALVLTLRPATPALAWVAAHEVADASASDPDAATVAAAAAPLLLPDAPQRPWLIDGAALATPAYDAAERAALAALAPALPADAPLTATAASLGLLGAAQPLIQAIALAACLRARAAPPIAGPSVSAPTPGPLTPCAALTPLPDRADAAALGLSAAAPGQAAAVRVTLSQPE